MLAASGPLPVPDFVRLYVRLYVRLCAAVSGCVRL